MGIQPHIEMPRPPCRAFHFRNEPILLGFFAGLVYFDAILAGGMAFQFRIAPFIADLGALTQRVGRSTFRTGRPKALYHYTTASSAKKIISTRELWATCVSVQEDLTELSHGIALVERVAMELIDYEPNSFVRGVFAKLPEFMRTRRDLVFITCFCGTNASNFHLDKYGSVCFKFDVPNQWSPILRCRDSQADSWYSPVIYGERDQLKAIKFFLTQLRLLIIQHTDGYPEHRGIASGAVRDIGKCLLTLVACFKREKHRPDQEWRLLLTPNLALSNTAPDMIDDAFRVCIVDVPKRHVCLRRKEIPPFQDGSFWPPTQIQLPYPFDEIVLGAETL